MEYRLTEIQKKWLSTRGGRTESDIRVAPNGKLFVKMSDGDNSYVRIYLPKI